MKVLRKILIPVFGLAVLGACSGAANGPVGNEGVGPATNFAQGTLGSQSDIQNMSRTCAEPYALRFSGEKAGDVGSWYIPQPDQKYFPTPGLIVKAPKEPVVDDEICAQCGGRVVRAIDFGEIPTSALTSSQYEAEFFQFVLGVRAHHVDPAAIAQARYQDFAVNPVGDVTINNLPLMVNHNYLFLLSSQVIAPVTDSTPLKSADELYAMQGCSSDPDTFPFTMVRALRVMDHEPASILNFHGPSTPAPTSVINPSVLNIQPDRVETVNPSVHPNLNLDDTSPDEDK